MPKRGRPKSFEALVRPDKYHIDYVDKDGTIMRWKYDLTRSKWGPIEVEAIFPNEDELSTIGYGENKEDVQLADETSESIPKSRRKYRNPANGKLVGYTRARNLGLVK